MSRLIIFLAASAISSLFAQPCGGFESLYQATYNFRPSRLTGAQSNQKSAQLERFWVEVKAQGRDGVLCLQSLVRRHPEDPYFQYDGATLLYSMDRGAVSLDLIASALQLTDVDEIPLAQFVEFCVQLSASFIDISQMATMFAGGSRVDGRLAEEHSPLNRLTGSLLLYGSMIPSFADRALTRTLQSPNPIARSTAMQVMAFLRTEENLRQLDSLYHTYALPDSVARVASAMNRFNILSSSAGGFESRESIRSALRKIPGRDRAASGVSVDEGFIADAINLLLPDDLSLVRDARRRSVTGANETSLNDFYALTNIINGIIARNNLYSRYRSY
jgi:hypothetical protein